jgi:hypothetical protein
MSKYQRGSEWRRWDLHVHTASSYDYSYNADDSDELLVSALVENHIAAVAITDHFIIDKVRIENLRTLASDIVFFPGVELRTDKGDTNIHVILIFSDKIDLDVLVESFNVFKREKGKEPDSNERVYWDYEHIIEFASHHKALISIHAGSKSNGVDNRITNKLEHNQAIKEEYAKTVNIFELGKVDDISGYRQHVFPSIGERPLVMCSDNHDPRNYSVKNKLWIKADVTFNGLKQIIYEPSERVCISEIKPEQKHDYQVIDRVEFHDDDFQSEPIYFSDKLNCIIGGKSTGKSILLHNLALYLDRTEVEKKDETSQTRTKKDVNLSVYWSDGKGGDSFRSGERKTIYVPQTYLNRLCDTQTERTEIDEIIQDIVLLNADARQAYEKMTAIIRNYKPEVNKTILDLLKIHKSIGEISMQMKEIGDKPGIETEKEKLTKEKDKLTQESSLSEEEVSSYEYATSQITELKRIIEAISGESSAILSIVSLVEQKSIDANFSEQIKIEIDAVQKSIIDKSDMIWKQEKERLIAILESKKMEISKQLTEYLIIVTNLKDKFLSNKAISELAEKVAGETIKLSKLEQLEKAKGEKERQKLELLSKAIASMSFYKEQHCQFADAINSNTALKTEDLQFSVEAPFRIEAFVGKLNEIFNNRLTGFKSIVNPEKFNSEKYTEATLSEISENILSGGLALKANNTPETALRDIFDDWFEIKYKVTMGGDSIDVMSPGKKALVLLKLLIELAESNCPILIDQPEDDLDNRSIFDELIDFIKKKKKDRQIIIVTHNANIVIGADAEEVIVANQADNKSPNRERRFEYRSGSIENDYASPQSGGAMVNGILNQQGIQQHICEILEGGVRAFELRKQKYHI